MAIWSKHPDVEVPHVRRGYDAAHQIAAQRTYASGRTLDRDALTGAASVFTKGTENPESIPPPSATRQWQTDAWGYVDLIGEVSNAARIYGNCFRRVNLVGAIANDEGTVSMTFDDDEPEKPMVDATTKILAELRSPYGSQAYLMERMGRNTFVAGECFLYLNDEIDGHPGTWEVLSTDELRPISSSTGYAAQHPQTVRWVRYYGPGFSPRTLPETAYICRIWRPHPRFSRHADSSMRALLEICDEIVLLTREVRGETVSRISSAGILAIADEFSFPNDDDAQPGTEAFDPFTREFINNMITSLTEKNTAAGVAPFVLRAPADLIEKGIKYMSFARPDAAVAMAKRHEALDRLAQGIELPPEWLYGHSNTTFANAFQITEDAFRLYIEPGLSEICEAITRGYLWPKLMQQAGLDPNGEIPDDIMKQVCWYDASHLISKPDRSKAGEDAYKNIEISGHAYRQVLGFTEDDAPSQEEIALRIRTDQLRQERVTIRAMDLNIPVIPDPALLDPANQPGNTVAKRPLPPGTDPYKPEEQQAAIDARTPPPAVSPFAPPGTPTQLPGPDGQQQAPAVEPTAVQASAHTVGMLSIRLHSAAELAVDKAVDKVGARLRSAVQRNPQTTALISGLPNALVAIEIGPTKARELLGDWDLSAAGEFAAFGRLVNAWAKEHGCDEPGDLVERVMALVETTARAKMFDPEKRCDLAAFTVLAEQALSDEVISVP